MSTERGVVTQGAVGTRAAGRFRLFRYEVRRWRDGVIPDAAEAIESPQSLSDDTDHARRLLELVPTMPTPVWGRDELHTGEMWNSNSFISWPLVRAGFDASAIHPPAGGRAPLAGRDGGSMPVVKSTNGLSGPLGARQVGHVVCLVSLRDVGACINVGANPIPPAGAVVDEGDWPGANPPTQYQYGPAAQ